MPVLLKAQTIELCEEIEEYMGWIQGNWNALNTEPKRIEMMYGKEKFREIIRNDQKLPLREHLNELSASLKKYPDPKLQELYDRALPFAYLHLKDEIEKLQKGLSSGTMTLSQFQKHLKELTNSY